MMTAYIALLRADGTEPDAASGYRRVSIDNVELIDAIRSVLRGRQIVFPDVVEPGYGEIAKIAIFDQETEGNVLWYLFLPKPLNVHEGVTPVIHYGQLYRGAAVKAKIVARSSDLCSAGRI